MTQDDIVEVENFPTRMDAEMAAGVLEAEGIYTLVSADDAGGTYPPLQYLRGCGSWSCRRMKNAPGKSWRTGGRPAPWRMMRTSVSEP